MRILIDAMGGDNAPGEIVRGAVEASREFHVDVALVGREAEILACLNEMDVMPGEHIQIVNAPDVISMEDDPSTATRKKPESSMSVALQMLHRGEGDAVISAGSTGALLSGATLTVRRIRGIRRACFGPVIPNGGKGTLLIDCGANVDARASHLVQFAKMGSIYMENVLGIKNPRVAIVNIGAEEEKGNALVKETFPLLKECTDINFVGSIEAREIPHGEADVIVCEAFVGNVILKLYEGLAGTLVGAIKKGMMSTLRSKIGAALALPALKSTLKAFDATQYGGAPLLGLNGLVVKTHGSAKAVEITNSIFQCVTFKEQDINGKIRKNIISSTEQEGM